MLTAQFNDMNYLTPQLDMEGPLYVGGASDIHSHLPGSSVKLEQFDHAMIGSFNESDLYTMDLHNPFSQQSMSTNGELNNNSNNNYSSSVQSLSPQTQYHQFSLSDLQPLHTTSTMDSGSDHSHPSPSSATPSRKGSLCDENTRAERRRAQNRAAQRAYRQRKDQSLKEREREIETLRSELDKAQRLNQTLWKVVGALKEKINDPSSITSIGLSSPPILEDDVFPRANDATPTVATANMSNPLSVPIPINHS